MEKTEQMIEIYQRVSKVCGGLTIVGLVISVVLFFRFRIRRIIDDCTGKSARQAMERMRKAGTVLGFCLLCALNVGTIEVQAAEFVIPQEKLDKENTRIYLRTTDAVGQSLECEESQALNGKSLAELEEQETSFASVTKGEGVYKLALRLESEANYTLLAVAEDQEGNPVEEELGSYCLDRTPPEIVASYDTEGRPTGDITWEAEQQTFLQKLIHGISFGYFCKPVMNVQIRAFDLVSGVEAITYTYEGLWGEEEEEVCVTETAVKGGQLLECEDSPYACVTLALPETFRGTIRAKAKDGAGLEMEEFTETIPLLAESEETHKRHSSARLLRIEGEGKKEGFYRSDVSLSFEMEDSFSGIRWVIFQAGDREERMSLEEKDEEAVTSTLPVFQIAAADYNENQIPIGVFLQDYAGHKTWVEELPEIHIDRTAPKVEVQWDNQDVRNEKYYRADRTAAIKVTERNFDPEDVHLELTGKERPALSWIHEAGEGCSGSEDPSDLGHADTCSWTARVEFSEEGDYSFGFSCVDAAGNVGSYDRTDTFVIDKTAPVLQVFWNPAEGQNEKYFNQIRRAVVEVKEQNFSPSDGSIEVTAFEKGEEMVPPEAGRFLLFEEQIWRAGVTFALDGVFRLRASCVDLAGNEAQPYESEEFVIDRTPPEITFGGVGENSANRREVKPEIHITDRNYTPEQVTVEFSSCNGTGQLPACHQKNGLSGSIWYWEDFSWVSENDDLYRIQVKTADLAGNQSEKTLHFSVNRFGSVYVLEKATEELAGKQGKYYTAKAPELVVTEYNADFLEEQEVLCSREGEMETLQEGSDYVIETAGDEATWKTYQYRIKAANFQKEGVYAIAITSLDRAGNRSGSREGNRLNFVVDRTAPEILITGAEERGRYRSSSKEVQIEIRDTYALQKAELYLNGKQMAVYEREYLQEQNGKIKYEVLDSSDWQTLSVKAWDMAGNSCTSESLSFLVTEKRIVQLWRSQKLLLLAAGFLAVVLAGVTVKRNTCNRKSI